MKGNGFSDAGAAAQNGTLHWAREGGLTPANSHVPSDPFLFEAHTVFRDVVLRPGFSCIGAKAAFHDGAYGFATYPELAAARSTSGLCHDLRSFAHSKIVQQSEYATFVAIFREPRNVTELTFEQLLWRQLQMLHEVDRADFDWDTSVSANPDDPQFSFSFAGRAFYVIGMHAHSSRLARTLPWPALVFNPHEQFERLRTDGKWKKMQKAIRARELLAQGTVNPMLSDFGEQSEARQYSGRAVPNDWKPPIDGGGKCPFH